jgi:hypothetical protein
MKIVISNQKFDYNLGVRLLRSKYRECPEWIDLQDIWDDIEPMTFKEVAKLFTNVEERRVAIGCIGITSIANEINPVLVKSETLKKQTTWVKPDGELFTKKFDDTYELYKVKKEDLLEGTERGWGFDDVYFLKFKDTSTDREYMLWIDRDSVARVNNKQRHFSSDMRDEITPTQCIAWTIQTDIVEGGIEKIVRQGDCILIKKRPNAERGAIRHLTDVEYKGLLVLES